MKSRILYLIALLFLTTYSSYEAQACTNFIITKGASSTGSAYLLYTCDGEFLYHLSQRPARDYPEGELLKLEGGVIKQVRHTFACIGTHINEHQVTIGETTFTGREELISDKNFLEYWTLMGLALQRSKTAREAIKVITDLVEEYGYASEGESFSIVDPNEAWILEMIGNGSNSKGANWVAVKIPDGMISAHANHARIGTFPLNDPESCLYSKNVISFATEKGYYDPKQGQPFEFNKAYDPASPEKLKYSESRVWSIFRRAAPSLNLSSDYHRGLSETRYPLWIKPDNKLTTQEVFNLSRDHYEGTAFDMTKGIDAGPYGTPQRNRPLPFYVDSVKYSFERPISTYNTSFSFIAQVRANMPNEVGGLIWFGFDETYFTCYTPLYCSIDKLPISFGKGDMNKYSRESAWWVFNFVSNYSNLRYVEMVKDMQSTQFRIENGFVAKQDSIEKKAMEMLKTDKKKACKMLTEYSVTSGNSVVAQWIDLGDYLVTKYNDGYIKNKEGDPQEKSYPQDWLDLIIKNEPLKYKIKDARNVNEVKNH